MIIDVISTQLRPTLSTSGWKVQENARYYLKNPNNINVRSTNILRYNLCLDPETVIYLNTDIRANAQTDGLGQDACVYGELDFLLFLVLKPSWLWNKKKKKEYIS